MNAGNYLLECFVLFLCVILHITIYKKISQAQLKSKRIMIAAVIASLILGLSNYYISPLLKSIINFAIMNITYILGFNNNWKKSLIVGLIIFFLGIINDLIISVLISGIGIYNLKILYNNYYYVVIVLTILNPIISLLLLKIKVIPRFLQKIILLKISDKIKSFCYILLLLGMVCIMVLNLKFVDNIKSRYYVILILVIFVLLIIATLSLYYSKHIITLENKKYKQMNADYNVISNNYKILRHNLINRLMSLKSVANKSTNNLINEMINQYKNEQQQIDIFDSIPKGIKGIIYQKIYMYEISDINFKIECSVSNKIISNISAQKYNALCEMLGLALDNAIESVSNAKSKDLFIDIYKDNGKIIFRIINSFENDMDIDLIGTKNYTTKKTGNGIGLNYILKNKTIKSDVKVQDGLFIISLLI